MAVRIAYNADHDERVFPPPPRTAPELIERLPFPTCGIPGIPDLMHHKYVVRDGESVWSGSTNWTTDSWTIQENFVVRADSPEVASAFTANFEELWSTRDVERTGRHEPRTISVDGHEVRLGSRPARARISRNASRGPSGGPASGSGSPRRSSPPGRCSARLRR